MIHRRRFLGSLIAGPALAAHQNQSRPNFVFVLTDDQRWDAMGCAGHPFLKTPNIDRLAAEGARFANAFVSTPLCSPSRASFLTGQYAASHGIVDNAERGAETHRLATYARNLQQHGYETAFIGKLHMGGKDDGPRPGHDHWISFRGQGQYNDPPMNRNGVQGVTPGYMTDILNRDGVEFIRRKRDRPFSMCVWHKAVHSPTTPAERHRSLYETDPLTHRRNVNAPIDGKPALSRAFKGLLNFPGQERKIRDQLKCLQAVDDGVGLMLDALRETGQLDNTVFVFAGDNGYFWGEHNLTDKRLAYEESIRIPLLLRYPKLIRPGTVLPQLVLNVDIAPSFLELAGAPIPSTVEGHSLVPLFQKGRPEWRSAVLTEYFADPSGPTPRLIWRSVRTQRWKYIHYANLQDADELYDLREDPFEMHNRIGEGKNRQVLGVMKAEMARELEARARN